MKYLIYIIGGVVILGTAGMIYFDQASFSLTQQIVPEEGTEVSMDSAVVPEDLSPVVTPLPTLKEISPHPLPAFEIGNPVLIPVEIEPEVVIQPPAPIPPVELKTSPPPVFLAVIAKIADSPVTRAQGLSGHAPLAENEGMLFLFEKKATLSFWMKEMLFPLDIIWLADGVIVDISANVPHPDPAIPLSALPTYSPSAPANQVLEVNAGWAAKNGVVVGDKIGINRQENKATITFLLNSLPPKVLLNAPFTSQAPFGNWNQPYQDSCEEATLLMAHRYQTGQTLTSERANQEILKMVDYQNEHYGDFKDATVEETIKLGQSFYSLGAYDIYHNPTVELIKNQLANDKVIIAPMAGQLLNNPHFTQPGPVYHMLLIIGYDDSSQEFIVNDPGTKWGQSFRYPYSTVMTALHDWAGDKSTMLSGEKVIVALGK